MPAVRISKVQLLSATAALSAPGRAEMAVPSYSHANPLIRWLFWKRLDTALELGDIAPGQAVLDFGTGSGILLPSLAAVSGRVCATDIELSPGRTAAATQGLEVDFVPLDDFGRWADLNASTLDCIFALDVLEHVETEELAELSSTFRRLLRPRGHLIVSGPTETAMYKLGRAIAGFKNEYHHRTIFDIDRVLTRDWRVSRRRYLPGFPLPRAFVLTRYTPT